MKHYTDINDIADLNAAVESILALKQNPAAYSNLGKGKTIGLLFFNNSLRTRLSTQKAAELLGLNCMVMNFDKEGWQLEFEDGVVMDGSKSEHIKEAAQVIGVYCDIVGIRAFPTLTDKEKDLKEEVITSFQKYAGIPVVNMESSTKHPLQALADAATIAEHTEKKRPKVVLTWAPHPKALPHAVANSFVKMMKKNEVEFVITHPKGYELDEHVVGDVAIEYDPNKAFKDADIIYAKNWSSFDTYGQILNQDVAWMVDSDKMKLTNNAKFMHCLPVRRNMVVSDEVLDSANSVVVEQANNRTYAAQYVLKEILENYE
jgi:N-succinyl-L-ornithine transcarbamylase